MGRFLAKFDAFVTNGPALAKRHERRGLTVHAAMPLGIERDYFSPDLRDARLRAALLAQCGLPPEGHLLLGMGRHHPEKRWPMVIDAVEAAGADLPVGLILLGNGVDRARLEARISGSPHIRMFRPVYDRLQLSRIMASCDALIHGSDAEPFGLVASEALASGLPLIVPDEGGCAEIAEPLFAETYRAREARSAADAIRRLFAREPTILRAAARHGRRPGPHRSRAYDRSDGLLCGSGRRQARRIAGRALEHVDQDVAKRIAAAQRIAARAQLRERQRVRGLALAEIGRPHHHETGDGARRCGRSRRAARPPAPRFRGVRDKWLGNIQGDAAQRPV